MPDPIRVILVDDQSLVRSGFRMLIESEDDMEVVSEASNGLEALDVPSWTSGCRRWTVSRPLDASRRPHWIPRC